MEFQTLIETRRSMRKYDPERQVTKEQVKEMVEAALLAPSWKNTETGRYYCLMPGEYRDKVAAECMPSFNANNTAGATLLVTTFVSKISGHTSGEPDNEAGDGWGFYDLGLQNENLVLKAKEMGIDTLIMGLRDADKLKEMCGIPAEETVAAVIALGYGAKEMAAPKRKDVDEVLKFV